MRQTLNNGYGILVEVRKNYWIVKAMFRGAVDIVFEGINRKECIRYCHEKGMRAIDEGTYLVRANPAFVKKNAKHPFRPEEWEIGVVVD